MKDQYLKNKENYRIDIWNLRENRPKKIILPQRKAIPYLYIILKRRFQN